MNDHFDKDEITDRFVSYASVFTQSEEGHTDTPSTDRQRDLARILTKELTDMGAADVYFDEPHCYVYATIPGNIPAKEEELAKRSDRIEKHRENMAPILGFVAHMDTVDAVPGATAVHPRVIDSYDGKDIVLNKDLGIVLSSSEYPDLTRMIGKRLVVTDGTSVLGADDKAGVVQIMEMASFFLSHPDIPHGTLRIMFTPDEETGNGTANVDFDHFACDYAYTIDGGRIGELEYENFNAATAVVTITGKSILPGSAKGVMRNACLVAMEYAALLPALETPYYTEGYEGFYHLEEMQGVTDKAVLTYIIRDHDKGIFEHRKDVVKKAARAINARYGEDIVDVSLKDSYYNMKQKIEPHMHLVENAKKAMEKVGVTPIIDPIRGGTDGCVLSYEGIPCPNLGTGGYNYHSRYEYACIDEMMQGCEILIRLGSYYASYELDEPKTH